MSEFVLPERIAVIELDDGAFKGAEIRARLRLPMGMLREVLVMSEQVEGDDGDPFGIVGKLGDIFCDRALVSWNLADAQGPLPTDRSGWDRLDVNEAVAIIGAWVKGIAGPPDPLPAPSSDTGPSPASSRNGRRKRSTPSRSASRSPSSVTS